MEYAIFYFLAKSIFYANIIPLIIGFILFSINVVYYIYSKGEEWLFEGGIVYWIRIPFLIFYLHHFNLDKSHFVFMSSTATFNFVPLGTSIAMLMGVFFLKMKFDGYPVTSFFFFIQSLVIFVTFYISGNEAMHYLLNG